MDVERPRSGTTSVSITFRREVVHFGRRLHLVVTDELAIPHLRTREPTHFTPRILALLKHLVHIFIISQMPTRSNELIFLPLTRSSMSQSRSKLLCFVGFGGSETHPSLLPQLSIGHVDVRLPCPRRCWRFSSIDWARRFDIQAGVSSLIMFVSMPHAPTSVDGHSWITAAAVRSVCV